MNAPQVRLVFDRKNTATTSKARDPKKGLVQIEVLYNRKRKFIGTGVKVYKDQWSDATKVRGRIDMAELNESIDILLTNIIRRINDLIKERGFFSLDMLDEPTREENGSKQSFLDFIGDRVANRGDISETTRKKHEEIIRELREFGRIVSFNDLTPANITYYDDFLHKKVVTRKDGSKKKLEQSTICIHHRRLKTYINMAVRMGLIDKSPYVNIRIERGSSRGRKYLSEDELNRIRRCKLPAKLEHVRDLFLFQCYTALSYADMAKFDFIRDAIEEGGKWKIKDNRVKTDEDYYIVLVSPAMSILKKYKYKLPVISNQKMNDYLKLIALAANVDKPISTHYGRHTFCVMAFNNDISPDVIARMMGHKNSRVTLDAYARLVTKTIDKGYEKMEDVFKEKRMGAISR